MKPRLLPLVLVPLIALAGCADSNQAVEYDDVSALTGDLGWLDCEQRDTPLVGESAADCKTGDDRVFVAVFGSNEDRDNQITKIRNTPAWHEQVPEVVSGERWLVQCEQAGVCGRVADDLGGALLSAPTYD